MSRLFYPRLAATSIRKNAKTYLPYMLTCIITVAMFYMITSLSMNKGISELRGSASIYSVLSLGSWVTGLFALIFLYYTNSFLIKRRKKEFGLYNILGMEKRHLSVMLFFECLFVAFVSLVIGLTAGVAFDKLAFLLLLSLFDTEIPLGFEFHWGALLSTLLLFGVIFTLLFLKSLCQIHLTKPIELLKGSAMGEREPKTKWLLAILGLLCLDGGYYIAVTTENPAAALAYFFLAVILVIVGTYCLFAASSIALLKFLKKRKRFYYQPRHFISVSGMIYRMKQNAVGLANICILSTMVLVMVSSTLSLYCGLNDIMKTRYPRDILMHTEDCDNASVEALNQAVDSVLGQKNIQEKNRVAYTGLSFGAMQQGSYFNTNPDSTDIVDMNAVVDLVFLPLESFHQLSGTDQALNDGEILIYSDERSYSYDTLEVFDLKFTVRERLEQFDQFDLVTANATGTMVYLIVVPDTAAIQQLDQLQQEVYGENASAVEYTLGFDVDGGQDPAIYRELGQTLDTDGQSVRLYCREDQQENASALYGGMFFIGIFLGMLFLIATILIIYYKQISEGYDDRERFEIMQKVGLDRTEVKRSIRSQVLTVFFLPLITAGVHVIFAFPAITRILLLFGMTNKLLFALCTLGTFLVFALFYALVYGVTAKIYYKIVSSSPTRADE